MTTCIQNCDMSLFLMVVSISLKWNLNKIHQHSKVMDLNNTRIFWYTPCGFPVQHKAWFSELILISGCFLIHQIIFLYKASMLVYCSLIIDLVKSSFVWSCKISALSIIKPMAMCCELVYIDGYKKCML